MSNFTEKLKHYAYELGIVTIGTAPVERYQQAPSDHRPEDFLPGAKSVTTFAYQLNGGPLNNLPVTRNQYMVEFEAVNQILLQTAHNIARFLESSGYESVAFGPESAIGDYPRLKGDFSYKHSAVLCGLGSFGINNLLLTPEHFARVRLACVITAAPLEYDEPLATQACHQCLKCVRACPSGALDNWEKSYSMQTGWIISKEKCAHYMFAVSAGKRCGLCVKACLS
ncbi:MAG: 4Fe-4S dicluster domain-containing protein [Eubacteriales bacterium]